MQFCLNRLQKHFSSINFIDSVQKQSPRGVPQRNYSAIEHQIYMKILMQKYAVLLHECSPVSLIYICRTSFYKNTVKLESFEQHVQSTYFNRNPWVVSQICFPKIEETSNNYRSGEPEKEAKNYQSCFIWKTPSLTFKDRLT